MKKRMARLLVTASFVCGMALSGVAAGDESTAPPSPLSGMPELQEKMMNDEGIRALVSVIQETPEMQSLLADPKALEAVQAGDIGFLLNDPRVQKLLDNPQVREIGKRVNRGSDVGRKDGDR